MPSTLMGGSRTRRTAKTLPSWHILTIVLSPRRPHRNPPPLLHRCVAGPVGISRFNVGGRQVDRLIGASELKRTTEAARKICPSSLETEQALIVSTVAMSAALLELSAAT
jgi:hypothetical protein